MAPPLFSPITDSLEELFSSDLEDDDFGGKIQIFNLIVSTVRLSLPHDSFDAFHGTYFVEYFTFSHVCISCANCFLLETASKLGDIFKCKRN